MPEHFHRSFDTNEIEGEVFISLRFKEEIAGEWSRLPNYKLHMFLESDNGKERMVDLSIKSKFGGGDISELTWSIINPKTKEESQDPELIAWIREVNPVIRITEGMLTGKNSPDRLKNEGQGNSFPKELQGFINQVKKSTNALFSDKVLNYHNEVDRGYYAAIKVNAYLSSLKSFKGIGIDVAEPEKYKSESSKELVPHKTRTPEKLGVLFLISALIQAIGTTSLEEIDPVWIIEDPEAHLHKTTLAAVSKIIRGISGQKILTTNSGALLSSINIFNIRRLSREKGIVKQYYVFKDSLSDEDLRRINYHLLEHRNTAFFSRVWLMVEGETEFWILPRFAKMIGCDFGLEGISCVEYAQSGLKALLKVANQLHIHWVLLADGDRAGQSYAGRAAKFLHRASYKEHIAVFPAVDIEHYLWKNGYEKVFTGSSGYKGEEGKNVSQAIKAAVKRQSKPGLALSIVEEAERKGTNNIPALIRNVIEKCVRLSRG
jgi:putative ATP-dependent endonuclease of OLD family